MWNIRAPPDEYLPSHFVLNLVVNTDDLAHSKFKEEAPAAALCEQNLKPFFPLHFFRTPLEKRREGKKNRKPFIRYNLMVTWLAAYPHWPPKPESQWVQPRQPGPGVRPSLFTSIGRGCWYSKRFMPPWALCPAWRETAVRPGCWLLLILMVRPLLSGRHPHLSCVENV